MVKKKKKGGAFVIENRIVIAVMQKNSQVGDFKKRDDETSHFFSYTLLHDILENLP